MNDMATHTQAPEPELVQAPQPAISRVDLTDAVRSTALLADLRVSLWTGERTDKKISAKLKEDAHAVGNTGRYIKNLLAGCDTELRATQAAYIAARKLHHQLTLPWVNNPHAERNTGARLLPNLLFHRYVQEMGVLQRSAKQKLDAFLAEYPALIQQAQANLAGLADPADYPSADEVRNAFKIDIDFQPVPDSQGFHGLPDAMLDKLSERLRARQERSIAASQADMWSRVREAVEHLLERLKAGPEQKFRYHSVEAVRELITLLPGFNCAGDARAGAVVEDIKTMLEGISAEDIRKDERVRQDVVSKAQKITDRLNQWGV